MQDKLYKYLKAKGGSASSVAIVGQLLNIRGARRDVAEKIVRGWVKDGPLFISDGLGNWYINPEERQKGTPLSETVFNLVEIRGNRRELTKSSLVEIGVCQIQNGKILEIFTDNGLRNKPNLRNKISLVAETKPLKDVLAICLPLLERGVLTSLNLPKVRNFIYAEIFRSFGEYSTFWELSLKELSRRLYPKHKINSHLDLANALEIPYYETDNFKIHMTNLSNLFLAIIEKVDEIGLKYLEEVLDFQLPKRKKIDFENLKISRRFIAELPETPGVYLIKNRKGEVVYVGKARNLKSRVGSYFYARESQDEKLIKIWNEVFDVKILELGSELEALLQEQKLIRKFQPEINLQMDVHVKTEIDSPNRNFIILLPSKATGYLDLFCANSSGKSSKLVLSQKADISNNVRQRLRRLFFSSRIRTPNIEERAQTEIILRWYEQNKDSINWIDVDQVKDLEDCLRLIEQYKYRKIEKNQRVIYR